jgi:SpoU rRNA methylase family enzyme
MLLDNVLTLKSNARILAAIKRAAEHKQSPQEVMEQRVSFVFGSMGRDSGVTKEQVRQAILNQAGSTAELAR